MVVSLYCLLHSTQKCKMYGMSKSSRKFKSSEPTGLNTRTVGLACEAGRGWGEEIHSVLTLYKKLPGTSVLQMSLPILFWACGIFNFGRSSSSPFLF